MKTSCGKYMETAMKQRIARAKMRKPIDGISALERQQIIADELRRKLSIDSPTREKERNDTK